MHIADAVAIDRSAGFLLIELLAALVVLTIAGLGIFYIGTVTATANTRSEDQAAALALGVDKVESLRNGGFDGLDASGSPYSDPANPLTAAGAHAAGAPFTRSWTIADATLNGLAAKRLDVTVSWTGGGSVVLSTEIVQVPSGSVATSTAFVKSWTQLR